MTASASSAHFELIEPELLHVSVQRVAVHAEILGGRRHVVVVLRERGDDLLFGEPRARARRLGLASCETSGSR